ncbi:MAG: hypothetical protein OSA23_04565 [Rhodospirillales bacterium]|nr:hypothetical protein [Rhodospirillales bacterium]
MKNFTVAANSTPLIVTLHLSLGDVKHNKVPFMYKLVKRALDVTVATDGPFEMFRTPAITSKWVRVRAATYKNIVFQENVTKDRLEKFEYIPIPILKCFLGYRKLLTTKKTLKRLKFVSNVEQFQQF